MRIIINLDRVERGNRRTPLKIRAFWDSHPKDDVCLHNCGVELYEMFADACKSAILGDTVIDFSGKRTD